MTAQRGAAGTWAYLAWWGEDGEIDLERTLGSLPASDRDMAALMAECWPGQMFYEPSKGGRQGGTWYLWDEQCQRPDRSKAIDRRIDTWTLMLDQLSEQCRQQHNIEAARRGEDEATADQAWEKGWKDSKQYGYAHRLRSTAGAGALRERLAGHVGTDTSTWPHHPLLVNTGNCVVSLDPVSTGWDWHTHDPALMMTYCLGTPWVPADPASPARGCPAFRDLLWHACGRDESVFWYLVHALGYSLLGANPYRLLFFLSGPTSSGKTTLMEIVSTVLEELAWEAKPELITKSARGERHGRHEASIIGRRLVTISETNDQLRLDENQIKSLTGQSRGPVDVIWKTELTGALITALVMIANNDMPEIGHMDGALQQRLKVLPMGETIPVEMRDAGKREAIVAAESVGILSLLVWACRNVVASGGRLLTMPPPAVAAKTAAYESEQDTIALWMAAETVAANGQSSMQKGSSARRTYVDWCGREDRIPLGLHSFYEGLGKKHGVVRSGSSDQAWFHGFILRNPPLDD